MSIASVHLSSTSNNCRDVDRPDMNPYCFLGGLSLHLNHLIAQRVAICHRPFGTLSIGIFLSNLDTGHLETYPRTYYGHFSNMSIFDGSRAVRVIFRKWVPSENQRYLENGWPMLAFSKLT